MASAFVQAVSLAIQQGSGSATTVASTNWTNSQESILSWDFSLSASQTDYALNSFAFTKTKVKAFVMLFDTTCLLETNSSSAPQESWTFVANVPYIWDTSTPAANPFAGNVTSGFLTNSTDATAVKIYILLDN